MRSVSFLILAALLSIQAGCGSTEDTVKSTETEIEQKKMNSTESISSLVVSFFSPGNGIDRDALSKLNLFLEKESEQTELKYRSVKWGKEGEIDYCFDLSATENEYNQDLAKRISELIGSSERVKIQENKPCRDS